MSAGYNSGLSEYPNKGKLNLVESEDPEDVLQSKVDQLVKLIEQAKSIVFHTGAGISTSTGIPDFRGPKGVWTLESQVNLHGRVKKIKHLACERDFHMRKNENNACFELFEYFSVIRKIEDRTFLFYLRFFELWNPLTLIRVFLGPSPSVFFEKKIHIHHW